MSDDAKITILEDVRARAHRLGMRLVGQGYGHAVVSIPEMEPDMRPRQLAKPFRSDCMDVDLTAVMRNRCLSCSEYDRCLQFAVAKDWQNFTCRMCPRFKPEEEEESTEAG